MLLKLMQEQNQILNVFCLDFVSSFGDIWRRKK